MRRRTTERLEFVNTLNGERKMDAMTKSKKARIAHLSGSTATIQNTPPLVTSNKARAKHGLPLLKDVDGATVRYDSLRANCLSMGQPTWCFVTARTRPG